MKVTKRDGSVEPVCLQAIQDRIQSMCNIDPQLEGDTPDQKKKPCLLAARPKMKLETACTLHCFKLKLQKKSLGIYKDRTVGKKINALFEHTKRCPHSCVVATTDEIKDITCEPCKVYALLQIKVHDTAFATDAAQTIAQHQRREVGQKVKDALIRHVRACDEKADCALCRKIGAALRKEQPERAAGIFDAYKDLCVRKSFAA